MRDRCHIADWWQTDVTELMGGCVVMCNSIYVQLILFKQDLWFCGWLLSSAISHAFTFNHQWEIIYVKVVWISGCNAKWVIISFYQFYLCFSWQDQFYSGISYWL